MRTSETGRSMVKPEPPRQDHPPLDRLIEYHEMRLDDAQAEDIRNHLSSCAACAEQVLDLADFNAPAHEPVQVAVHRDARLLARTIVGEERVRRWQALFAIAAGIMVATVGTVAYRELAPSGRWARGTEFALASVYPESESRFRGKENSITLAENLSSLGLILNLVEPAECQSFRYVVRDSTARVIVADSGIRPTRQGQFQILIPARKLATGTYEIELYGLTGCDRKLETFRLKIRRDLSPSGT